MRRFEHQRHKPPSDAPGASELIVACPPMHSQVNLSRVIRAAGCCGVRRMIVSGKLKVDAKIARDAVEQVQIESHRSLRPVLQRLRAQGYALVGLEQTTNSQCLYDFAFPRRCVLVIGHERLGVTNDLLEVLDHVVEIPVYGKPLAHNVATATAIALYEYCRQHSPQ
jgi:tRNA G18 (ribose-2'-O)-methylase SpoU